MKVKDECRRTNVEGKPKSQPVGFRNFASVIHSSFVIRHSSFQLRPAFSLIECLAYVALFFVVLSVALAAYYRIDEQARGFARNSADIVRTVQAGERWRADMRSATNAARLDADQELRLITQSGEVNYYFRDGTVWRQGTNEPHAVPILLNVKASAMEAETRPQVKAWRWELELQTKRTNATVRPLFTFLAVPSEAAR